MDLLLHPSSRRAINQYIQHPTHALLITGQQGSGKLLAALQLAQQLLQTDTLTTHPYFLHLDESQPLSIDTIRQTQQFLRLKTAGTGEWRRALIVQDAERLTHEAQNAFLKQLEEPPADTLIILTTHDVASLLPTVRSRLQTIELKPVPKPALVQHFSQTFATAEVERAFHMSAGAPGLMSALLKQDQEHEMVRDIADAKILLTKSSFERLCQVDAFSKQKDRTSGLLDALRRVCQAAVHHAALKDKPTDIRRWHSSLSAVIEAQSQLAHSPPLKLLWTNLLLKL